MEAPNAQAQQACPSFLIGDDEHSRVKVHLAFFSINVVGPSAGHCANWNSFLRSASNSLLPLSEVIWQNLSFDPRPGGLIEGFHTDLPLGL